MGDKKIRKKWQSIIVVMGLRRKYIVDGFKSLKATVNYLIHDSQQHQFIQVCGYRSTQCVQIPLLVLNVFRLACTVNHSYYKKHSYTGTDRSLEQHRYWLRVPSETGPGIWKSGEKYDLPRSQITVRKHALLLITCQGVQRIYIIDYLSGSTVRAFTTELWMPSLNRNKTWLFCQIKKIFRSYCRCCLLITSIPPSRLRGTKISLEMPMIPSSESTGSCQCVSMTDSICCIYSFAFSGFHLRFSFVRCAIGRRTLPTSRVNRPRALATHIRTCPIFFTLGISPLLFTLLLLHFSYPLRLYYDDLQSPTHRPKTH